MAGEPTDDRLFGLVFRRSADALVLVDAEGAVRTASPAAASLFEESPSTLAGRDLESLPGVDDAVATAWATLEETGAAAGTCTGDGTDGLRFAAVADVVPRVHLVAFRGLDADSTDGEEPGDVAGGLASQPDQGLPRALSVTARAFEASPDGVLVVDADGVIEAANRRAASLFDGPREELEGRPVDDEALWPAADGDPPHPVTRVLAGEAPVFDVERAVGTPGNETRWASIDAVPLEDGAVATLADVTDRRECERLLGRIDRRLERYSATVSHDLRSPLSVVSGWIDIAIAEDSTADLEKARAGVDRLEAMIADLRTVGEVGQLVHDPAPVDLAAAAREAWTAVDVGTASLELDDGLASLPGDEERVVELFEHLFRNVAIHAGDAPTVTVSPLEGGFVVEDDGPGIPAGERESVFRFGYTVDGDRDGVGLAVVAAIADGHGWHYDVTEPTAGGARFEFRRRWHPEVPR